jgi:hypothetical protein
LVYKESVGKMKIKYFGGTIILSGFGQVRIIAVDVSYKNASERMYISLNHIRNYFSETFNTIEIQVAKEYLKGELGVVVFKFDYKGTVLAYGKNISELITVE